LAGAKYVRPVQIEPPNRGSAGRCDADDLSGLCDENKVLRPSVIARIEKFGYLTGRRIDGVRCLELSQVA